MVVVDERLFVADRFRALVRLDRSVVDAVGPSGVARLPPTGPIM
jgi:hypothetical protein